VMLAVDHVLIATGDDGRPKKQGVSQTGVAGGERRGTRPPQRLELACAAVHYSRTRKPRAGPGCSVVASVCAWLFQRCPAGAVRLSL